MRSSDAIDSLEVKVSWSGWGWRAEQGLQKDRDLLMMRVTPWVSWMESRGRLRKGGKKCSQDMPPSVPMTLSDKKKKIKETQRHMNRSPDSRTGYKFVTCLSNMVLCSVVKKQWISWQATGSPVLDTLASSGVILGKAFTVSLLPHLKNYIRPCIYPALSWWFLHIISKTGKMTVKQVSLW